MVQTGEFTNVATYRAHAVPLKALPAPTKSQVPPPDQRGSSSSSPESTRALMARLALLACGMSARR